VTKLCPICDTPGQACGDDHITAPVITSDTLKGRSMSDVQDADKPVELKVYEYYIGHVPIQAQMSAEQAEAMGAKEPGQAEDPKVGEVPNNEAELKNTHMAKADVNGAEGEDPEALNKARETRNRRASR
jgi:hypothetical protein